MSLLNAGKRRVCLMVESVGNVSGYGRGLFIVDPKEIAYKERKIAYYKYQLRIQAEEDRRRKQAEKEREKLLDERHYQKYLYSLKNESHTKKGNEGNNNSGTQKSQSDRIQIDSGKVQSIPTPSFNFDEEKYSHPRLPPTDRPKDTYGLFQYMMEQQVQYVFKKINNTRGILEVDKELYNIRNKLRSHANLTRHEQIGDYMYSHFYSVPRSCSIQNATELSSYEALRVKKDVTHQYQGEYREKRYYNKHSQHRKKHRVRDRYALDLQIESIMGGIDHLLNT